MKCKSLALVLALVMVVLLSFGSVSYAETMKNETRDFWFGGSEIIFEPNTENILEEGLIYTYLQFSNYEDVTGFKYVIDEGSENEKTQDLSDKIAERIRVKEEFPIGTTHTLTCKATYSDGDVLEKSYTFKSVTRHKNYDQLCMNVRLNGECMYQEHYYTVKNDDVISVDVKAFSEEAPVYCTGYYWADPDTRYRLTNTVDFYDEEGTYFEIKIPEKYYGTRKILMVESVLISNNGKDDATRRSGWQAYYLNFGESMSVTARIDEQYLYDLYRHLVKNGDTIVVSATSLVDSEIDCLGYYFVDYDTGESLTDIVDINADEIEIKLPEEEPGTRRILYVEPIDKLDDGRLSNVTKTGWQKYILIWADDTPINDKEVFVKYDDNYLEEGSTTEVSLNEYLNFSANHDERVFTICFEWDDENGMIFWGSPADLEIPADFSVGSTHKLTIKAEYNNGEESDTKTFYVTIAGDNVDKD